VSTANGVDDLSALEQRIAEARAKRDAIEARSKAQKRIDALKREAEEAERAAKEAEVLEQLEGEHGPLNVKIRKVLTPEGMLVVKKPPIQFYQRFQKQLARDGADEIAVMSTFIRPYIIYPDKTERERLLEEYPHSLIDCANAGAWLNGAGRKELEGK
jgi:hypothetical protein